MYELEVVRFVDSNGIVKGISYLLNVHCMFQIMYDSDKSKVSMNKYMTHLAKK